MKTLKFIYLVLIIGIFSQNVLSQDYPLQISISPKGYFTPFLGDFYENPSKYLNISVNSMNAQSTEQIYFQVKFEQISPNDDIFMATKANSWRPAKGITILPNRNTIIKTYQMQEHFSNISDDDFNIIGFNIDDYRDAMKASTRIPEGTYRICVYACDFNQPMNSIKPLSDPESGCGVIRICYKASQPDWIKPFPSTIDPEDKEAHTIKPKGNIRFQWNIPMSGCAMNLNKVKYDFKLVEVINEQSIEEAISNNSSLISEEDIRNRYFNLDTIKHPYILENNKKYAAQITAKTEDDKIIFENEGKSKICWFIYKKDEKPDPLDMVQVTPTAVDCGVELPKDKKPIKKIEKGDEVKIGKFTMKISSITSSGNKKFSGEGSIKAKLWNSSIYTMTAFNVKVKFKNIRVNENKEVFEGSATGIFKKNDFGLDAEFSSNNKYLANGYNFIKDKFEGSIKSGVKKADVDKIGNFIGAAKAASATAAETPQTLPLGLRISNELTDDHGFNIAVSDMFFTPKGAMFSMVFLMHIPEIESYLAFGASDLCMYANPFKNGRLSLLADMQIPLGSKDYKLFVEGANTTEESVNTTYVKWTVDGFGGVQLAGRLELPKDQIINLKDKTKPVNLKVSSSFQKWGDWMATISMEESERFAFTDLEDFEFTMKNATYDHSSSRSAQGFEKAINDLGKDYSLSGSINEFEGLFIKDIGVSMPKWIKSNDSDKDSARVSFNIENAFYDNFGFNMNIAANDVLNAHSGKLGGWGFSVDKIGIKIIKNSLREGFMNGKFVIPLASTENSGYIGYKAAIRKDNKKDYLSYEFIVKPDSEDGLKYNFLKYFQANLTEDSNITVNIEDRGPKIKAEFNGKLNIDVEEYKAKITAVSFQGLRIANYDKKGKPGFDFNWGTWELGDGTTVSDDGSKKKNNDSKTEGSFSDDKMFKTAASFKICGFKAGIGKPDFNSESLDADDYKDVDKATKISLGLPIIMSLDKFGEGKTGEEMCAVRTKLKFIFPLGYKIPDADADYFGLEMPKIDYSEFKCEFEDIAIRGEFGPVKMYGVAQLFKEHETYGDGFRGSVKVEFPMGIRAYSTVQFGTTTNELDYWYVDGGASFGNMGLEVAGLFAINGFGGGVYKNMLRKGDVKFVTISKDSNGKKKANKPKKETNAEKETNEARVAEMEDLENPNPDLMPAVNMSTLGAGSSGIVYEPQKGGLGFYAQLDFCASNSQGGYKTFYGSGKLEMSFKDGGFNSATIDANVSAMNTKDGKGIIDTECKISYNHPNKHFYLKAKVNMDSGIEGGPNASIPFLLDIEKEDFYIALGEPVFTKGEEKTIHYSLFDFKAGNDDYLGAHAHMYLDAYILGGNAIPAEYNMPAPPDKVAEFLDMSSMTNYRKNTNSVKKKGFMMGARLDGDFGFTYGPIYGDLEILAGIDVELINAEGAKCSDGRSIGGFNGYYARGQAYAYLHGDVGVKLKLFGRRKKFSLCDITAGAMVQAGIKDPSWFKGKARVRGRILGGLIKFNTSAKFKVGKICEPPVKDPLDELVIIESIEPAVEVEASSTGNFSSYRINQAKKEAESEKVSVFTVPQIACNVEMERYFEIVYESGDKTIRRDYVFKIEDFKYTCKDTEEKVILNKDIIGKKGEKFALLTKDMLRPNSTYEIDITVRAWEIIDGYLKNPIDENGNHYVSIKRQLFYFKTDALPNRIVKDNIITSYPIENQFETFPKENKYRIIMSSGVDYLFKDKYGRNFAPKELIGEYINISNPSQPNIVFNYKYINNGYGTKPNIEFDMDNYYKKIHLWRGNIYKVKLYVPKSKEEDVEFEKKQENIKIGTTNNSETDDENFGKQDNSIAVSAEEYVNAMTSSSINNSFNTTMPNVNLSANLKPIVLPSTLNSNSSSQDGYKGIRRVRGETRGTSDRSRGVRGLKQGKTLILKREKRRENPSAYISGTGKAKVVIKDSSTGKEIINKEDKNSNAQTSVDKLKQMLSDKGKRTDFELIYENYFRVSGYSSLKTKFSNVAVRSGLDRGSDYYHIVTKMNIKDEDGDNIYTNDKELTRSQPEIRSKLAVFIFPEYTTREEIYNYYAYSNVSPYSRAERQPSMVQFEALINNDGREDNIVNNWNKMSGLLNNIITTPGVDFALPLTEYKGAYYNKKELNVLNIYDKYSSTKLEDFQGPLTSAETQYGRLYRNNNQWKYITYMYKNIISYAFVHHMLALFSDFILDKDYDLDELTDSRKSYFKASFWDNQFYRVKDNELFRNATLTVPNYNNTILNVCNKIYPPYKNKLINLKRFWNSYDEGWKYYSSNYDKFISIQRHTHYNQIRLGEHYIQYYFVKPENYYKLWKEHNPKIYLDKNNSNKVKIRVKYSDF